MMSNPALRRGLIAAAVSLLTPLAAAAQESNTAPLPVADGEARAEWRTRGVALSEFPLDASGATLEQSAYVEHRLRAAGNVKNGPIVLAVEADLANGLLFGDTATRFPYLQYRRDEYGGLAAPSTFLLRQLYLEARTPVGLARIGHTTSMWGLGLVANDGAGQPDWGDHYHGDLVERLLVATRPLSRANPRLAPLVVALAGDVVYRDQTADLVRDDRAYQGVLSVAWAPEGAPSRAGIYAVRRGQVDRDGFRLDAWILDAHAKLAVDREGWGAVAQGEIVRVWGETDIVRDVYDGSRVIDQMGAAVELGAGFGGTAERRKVEAILQAGWASGDDRAHDGRISAFKFDPEYNVGFILFEEVLAFQSAATARNASDPIRFGRPAPGARLLPTEGAVTNARYVMPTLRYAAAGPVTLRAGVLFAQADRPLDDAFQTNAEAGGVRRTSLGSATDSLDLGIEIDVGARYLWERERGPDVAADLQIGRFLPGAAFVDAAGERMDPVDRLLAGVTLLW